MQNLKTKLIKTSNSSGIVAIPKKDRPLQEKNEVELCKALGKCYVYSEDGKAPGIDDFPGDFTSGHPGSVNK